MQNKKQLKRKQFKKKQKKQFLKKQKKQFKIVSNSNFFLKKNKNNNKFLNKISKNLGNIITKLQKMSIKSGKILLINNVINYCFKYLKKNNKKNLWINTIFFSKKIKIDLHRINKQIDSITVLIPKILNATKGLNLGLRLFFYNINKNKEKSFKLRLLNEFIYTLESKSETIKLKKKLYKILLKAKPLLKHRNYK